VNRTGLTLVELLVVLALIGVVLGVAGVSLPEVRTDRISANDALAAARRQAVFEGRPVTIQFAESDSVTSGLATALPDGRTIGPQLDERKVPHGRH